jgi:hypothetical protein
MMIKQFGFGLGLALLVFFQSDRALFWSGPFHVSQSASMTVDKKNNSPCRTKAASDDAPSAEHINVAIQTDSLIIRKGAPFLVKLRIENLSNEALDLTKHPLIILEGAEQSSEEREQLGLNFSSDTSITYRLPPAARNRSALPPGESIEIEVDIESLKWSQRFLSAYHPQSFASVVPNGSYILYVRIWTDDKKQGEGFVKNFNSNQVPVSVQDK